MHDIPHDVLRGEQTVGGGNIRGLACPQLIVGNCPLPSADMDYSIYWMSQIFSWLRSQWSITPLIPFDLLVSANKETYLLMSV